MIRNARLAPLLCLMLIGGLSGCGDAPVPAPPQNFPPLDYSYLPPIRLNIANISIDNGYAPDPAAATLIAQDPEAPADALTAMLQHRLVPDGTPGNGTVTIETASLEQVGNNYVGAMSLRLNVASADGLKTGFTEASVSVTRTVPDPDAGSDAVKAALYGVTRQLMDSMNVQLQYQIQRNMGSWVTYGLNAAAAPITASGIDAAPLGAPGSPPALAQPVPAGASPAPGAPEPATSGQPQSLTHTLGSLPVTPLAPPVTPPGMPQ